MNGWLPSVSDIPHAKDLSLSILSVQEQMKILRFAGLYSPRLEKRKKKDRMYVSKALCSLRCHIPLPVYDGVHLWLPYVGVVFYINIQFSAR